MPEYTERHATSGIRAKLPPLECWPNQYPAYEVTIEIPEFTSVCPRTGLPDFGILRIRYLPRKWCVELKALKLYVNGYRNLGIFQENAVNRILRDFVAAVKPVWAVVSGEFNVRGGMKTTMEARYPKPKGSGRPGPVRPWSNGAGTFSGIFFFLACLASLISSAGCALFRPAVAPPKTSLEQARGQIHVKGPSILTAGVAKVEITPAVGTPLAGYSKRKGKPSSGIRDPLYVRVLSLSDGQDQVVLVSADLLIFPYPLAEAILGQVSQELKIPRQAILLTTTHTHSGSGSIAHGFLYEKVFGRYRPEIVEGIKGRLIWAIRQAVTQQQPVRWAVRERPTGVLDRFTENRRNPGGPTDPALTILFVESLQGQPLGVLVNAAAHPTLLDSQDLRLSGDYPGELTSRIESTYPGVVCLFTNGAAGDVRPVDLIGSTPEERVSRFGRLLAEAATGMINQAKLKSTGELAAWGFWIPLPPPQVHIGWIPIHPRIGRLMRPTVTYLHLLTLNDSLLVPLPAEMTAELGRQLKDSLQAQGLQPILLGYSDGYLGYAVTPQEYRTRAYEAWMSWYGPTLGASLIEQIERLAHLYPERESPR